MIRFLVPAFGLVAVNLAGDPASAQDATVDLEIDVTIAEFGPDGKSWDGARIYLLPFETTTVTPPEPALCVHTDVGENVCIPNGKTPSIPCPDSFRCSFKMRFERPFNDVTVSIFDIDPLGRDAGDAVGRLIGRGLRGLEEFVGHDLHSERVETGALSLNERRWEWVETMSFQLRVPEGERPTRNTSLEARARRHAAGIAPPQMTSFERGRIAAPFDLRPLGDCLYPMPACSYGYVTVSIRSEMSEEELSGWD